MKSKGRNSILKKIIGTLCIPVVTLLVMILLCQRNGVVFFESEGNWILFFRATATVMLTTFALSLNLNSGRFDFSIGAISLVNHHYGLHDPNAPENRRTLTLPDNLPETKQALAESVTRGLSTIINYRLLLWIHPLLYLFLQK